MARRRRRVVKGQVIAGIKDVISQPLYDTIQFSAASVGDQVFFAVPIGAGKTLWHTNMRQAGEVSRGQKFDCYGLSLTIQSAGLTLPDWVLITETAQAYVVFTFLNKVYYECPLYLIPTFNYPSVYNGAVAANSLRPFNNVPYLKFEKEIVMKGKENFDVTIRLASALGGLAASVYVTMFLHGRLWRNVQ